MDTPTKEKTAAELRDYLAEERTFLAWIRTGIALMGFGFVVAHFGVFADEPQLTRHDTPPALSPRSFHSGLERRLSRSA
jgi:uncharacterized membrane protein YidH (DUF202 family)